MMGTKIIDEPHKFVKRYWGGMIDGVMFIVRINKEMHQDELVDLILTLQEAIMKQASAT